MYQQNYNDPYMQQRGNGAGTLQLVNTTMRKVYLKMTLALIVTALTALFCAGSDAYKDFLIGHTWIMWVYVIAEFGIVIGFSGALTRMSNATATLLFYGYFTDRDLSKIGSFLTMALFGLIIAMVVNIFLSNNALDWIISIVGVFIFVGLTAWDTQQVKTMAAMAPAEYSGRLATIGALNLYLDFINLFLMLLRLFGNNND